MPQQMELFSYFMVRVHRSPAAERPCCSGLVERLDTGEKRTFSSAEELVGLLAGWRLAAPPEPPC